MIWLSLLKRFWQAGAIAILIAVIWAQGLVHDKTVKERNKYQTAMLSYQQSANEWHESFKASEIARQTDQQAAVGAVNAEAKACDVRVQKAIDSAVKIERIVTREPRCAPGTSPVYSLVDPRSLSDALSAP